MNAVLSWDGSSLCVSDALSSRDCGFAAEQARTEHA